jgi:cell wall-associated NlpC family hydrolase
VRRVVLFALPLLLAAPAAASAASAVVRVSVATLWKQPRLARPLDAPSLAVPADPRAWSRNLATTQQRLWLDSRVQTQALYGQRVVVLVRRGGWAKVAVVDEPDPQDPHGYPGWLPVTQLAPDSLPAASRFAVVTARTAWLRSQAGKRRLELSFATRLPLLATHGDGVTVATPDGGEGVLPRRDVRLVGGSPRRPTGVQLVAAARAFLGVRYLWGGLSAFGFDCSGIVWAAYRSYGVTIPRDADPQFRAVTPVSPKTLRIGDLLFYGTRRYVHHVAIYAGDGRMLEAPDSAHRVRIVPVRWGDFAGAGRFAR